MTVYNTGKVKVGLRYQDPKPGMTPDDERLQKILLGRRSSPWVDIAYVMVVVFSMAALAAWWS